MKLKLRRKRKMMGFKFKKQGCRKKNAKNNLSKSNCINKLLKISEQAK